MRAADESALRNELDAELLNLRALLGRDVRYITDFGGAAARIVAANLRMPPSTGNAGCAILVATRPGKVRATGEENR